MAVSGDIGQMLSGKLKIDVTVSETVFGDVIGLKMKNLGGGHLDVDKVEKEGRVTGLKVGQL
jgi:hypothetical protein